MRLVTTRLQPAEDLPDYFLNFVLPIQAAGATNSATHWQFGLRLFPRGRQSWRPAPQLPAVLAHGLMGSSSHALRAYPHALSRWLGPWLSITLVPSGNLMYPASFCAGTRQQTASSAHAREHFAPTSPILLPHCLVADAAEHADLPLGRRHACALARRGLVLAGGGPRLDPLALTATRSA